jgi:ubiquinone/menaquinone biosynthesis C-methylase UbiE
LPAGSRVLEVAPGPGYFCIELAKLGSYTITGMDLSRTFVKMAAEKAAQAKVQVQFVHGSASNMPFPKESFDFLLCRAAFKNFADPIGALKEMCRVLRSGGTALLIDLSRDAQRDEVSRAVDEMGLSTANRVLTKLVFKTMLIRSAYSRAEFKQMLAQTAFSRVEISGEGMGFEITMTK